MTPSPTTDEVHRLTATRIDAPRCGLGESPRWREGAWWWVDAEAGLVWTAGPELLHGGGTARVYLDAGTRVSLVEPVSGGAVVAVGGTLMRYVTGPDGTGGSATVLAALPLEEGELLNDGSLDAAGRVWIGSVSATRAPGSGRLFAIEADGTVHEVDRRTALSNGMAWPAPDRLLHADSLARAVREYRIDPEQLTLEGVEVLLELEDPADTLALPDGLSLDSRGHLWVAVYGRGEVRRYAPHEAAGGTTGWRRTAVVEVPTAQTTSVAVGGPEGRDILITTAQEGMSPEQRASDDAAGALYRAQLPA